MANMPGRFDLIDVHFNVTLPIEYNDDEQNSVWYHELHDKLVNYRQVLENYAKLLNPFFEVELEI